jgi:hypothetical protein
MKQLALAAVVAVAACAHSDAEIKTAKLAQYSASPAQLYNVALEVAQHKYKIAASDPEHFDFWTTPRFYSPEGDLQSEGAGGVVKIDNHSVQVAFHVAVVSTTPHSVALAVTPQTFQVLAGSPKPRELAPDDPYLPPFVLGRADELQFEIYDQARALVVH